MSEPIDERQEAILLELLSTSADPRADFAASELAGDSRCTERFEDLMDMRDFLNAAGRQAREEIAEAESLAGAPGEGRVEQVLGELIQGESRNETAPALQRWMPWIAAAALLVTLGLWMRGGGDPDPRERQFLSAVDDELHTPRGEVSEWPVFEWAVAQPERGWYVLRIKRTDGSVLYTSGELEEPRWDPKEHGDPIPADVRHILWEVDPYDGSAPDPSRTLQQEAWLR